MRAFLLGVAGLVVLAVLAVLWLPELASSPRISTPAGALPEPAAANTAGGAADSAHQAATEVDALASRRVAAASVAEEPLHGTVTGPDGAPRAGATVTAACSDADEYGLLD